MIFNLVKKIKGFFSPEKKEDKEAEVLYIINEYRGILWERIEQFKDVLLKANGVVKHHTKEMEDMFPLTHHIDNGMYTRTVKMPKGSLVVSFIHKQNHPSLS